jgi:hypothetical protein
MPPNEVDEVRTITPWENLEVVEYDGGPVYVDTDEWGTRFFAGLVEACERIVDDDMQLDPEVICRVHPCTVGPVETPDAETIWDYITEQWQCEYDEDPPDIEDLCDTGIELLEKFLEHIRTHAPSIWRPQMDKRIDVPEDLLR